MHVSLFNLNFDGSVLKLLEVFWRFLRSSINCQTSQISLLTSYGLSRKYLVCLWWLCISSYVNSKMYFRSSCFESSSPGPFLSLGHLTILGSSPLSPPWVMISLSSFVSQIYSIKWNSKYRKNLHQARLLVLPCRLLFQKLWECSLARGFLSHLCGHKSQCHDCLWFFVDWDFGLTGCKKCWFFEFPVWAQSQSLRVPVSFQGGHWETLNGWKEFGKPLQTRMQVDL